MALLLALVGALFFVGHGLAPANILLTLLSLVLVASVFTRGLPKVHLRETWPYLAYLAALTVSLAASRTTPSLLEFGRQLLFLAVVFAVARTVRDDRQQRLVVAVMAVCAMIVISQALLFAWQSEQVERLVRYPVVPQWSGYPELGLLAAVFASGALALALFDRSVRLRFSAAYLAAFFTIGSVFLYSRSAWVTIAVTAVWLAAIGLVNVSVRRTVIVLALLGVVALGTSLWFVPTGAARDRLAAIVGAKETADRVLGWRTSLTMLRDHPIVGVGPGMYRERYDAYQSVEAIALDRPPRELERDRSHAYNMILHVAAELGLLGLLGFLAMWGRILWIGLVANPDARSLALATHAMLVAFFIRSQSEHFLANLEASHRLLLLLAVLFGLAEGIRAGSLQRAGLSSHRRG
jgi:O-antigen ligase